MNRGGPGSSSKARDIYAPQHLVYFSFRCLLSTCLRAHSLPIHCLATSIRCDPLKLILPYRSLISTACPMIKHALDRYQTSRKSQFSVSRLISSSSRSKPIIACYPSPLLRSFILGKAFRHCNSVSVFALANACSIPSIPIPSMTSSSRQATFRLSRTSSQSRCAGCGRYAHAMLRMYVKYVRFSHLWLYTLSCRSHASWPPILVELVMLLIG